MKRMPPTILDAIQQAIQPRQVYTFIYPDREDGQAFHSVLAHSEAEARLIAARDLSGIFGGRHLTLWDDKD